jgi:hypothetical protein
LLPLQAPRREAVLAVSRRLVIVDAMHKQQRL